MLNKKENSLRISQATAEEFSKDIESYVAGLYEHAGMEITDSKALLQGIFNRTFTTLEMEG